MTKFDKQSSSHLWQLHGDHSEGTRPNSLETQSICSVLDKIIQGTGQRIAILANKVICNHHQRHSSRRLHVPCRFSERRSSPIRDARNTEASTQGYVKE